MYGLYVVNGRIVGVEKGAPGQRCLVVAMVRLIRSRRGLFSFALCGKGFRDIDFWLRSVLAVPYRLTHEPRAHEQQKCVNYITNDVHFTFHM